MPNLSIIVPVRNQAHLLVDCLHSITTFSPESEVIVQDSMSLDNPRKVAERYGANVRFYSEHDTGIYDAMNKAIGKATGNWFLFLGADDRLAAPGVVEMLIKVADSSFHSIIAAGVEIHDASSTKIPRFYTNQVSWQLNFRNSLHHQGLIYHRSVFDVRRFETKYPVLADYALSLELVRSGTVFMQSPLVIAHSGGDGVSKQFRLSLYTEELRMKSQKLPFILLLANLFVVPAKFLFKRL